MDTHSETLEQLLASAREHATPPAQIDALPALHRGEVIEIQGPASSGKTHLLYRILVAFLAPSQRPQIAAVVYDTDASFDIHRLRHLLFTRIARPPSSTRDPHDAVRRALARLHLFRPTSLQQLAASIANLPAYHAAHMPNQEIALLAVDSISAFHWPARYSAEQLRNTAPERPTSVPPRHHVLAAIQSVRRSHRPLTVLTNWALGSATRSESLHVQHRHPFPALDDAIPDPDANVSTDHSPTSPFRLAHHIALSSLDCALSHEVRCLTSGTRDTVRFTLRITDDDILVQPP